MKTANLPGRRTLLGCTALLAIASAAPAQAGTVSVTFNFDNLCGYANTACTGSSSQNAASADIANYMTDVLKSAGFSVGSASVTGAVGQQGNTGSSYTADSNVVGPSSSDPLTLGSTQGSTPNNTTLSQQDTGAGSGTNSENVSADGYIINCNGADYTSYCSAQSDNISLQFNNLTINGQQYQIASVSFDLQIFPDISCTSITKRRKLRWLRVTQICPDFTLLTSPRWHATRPDLVCGGTGFGHDWGVGLYGVRELQQRGRAAASDHQRTYQCCVGSEACKPGLPGLAGHDRHRQSGDHVPDGSARTDDVDVVRIWSSGSRRDDVLRIRRSTTAN